MIGAGGFAGVWVRDFLPAFRDRLSVAGLVDVNRQTLDKAGDLLGLTAEQRFTDMGAAFANTKADFCIMAIPPGFNKQAVSLAVEHHLPVLSEKPIANSWQSCLDILGLTQQAGLKMAIIQNYRYTKPILTMKRVLEGGELGAITYVSGRFTVDHRHNGGGRFRYDIPDIMLYEASVHHFDQLRNLSGADCEWITGKAWNPPGSGVDTDCCGLFVMGMTNGVKCQYETSYIAVGAQNDWYHEYYRVDCEKGSLVVDRDQTVRLFEHIAFGRTRVTEVEEATPTYESHLAIIDQFLNWLDGGPAPQTAISDNIRTDAICFAAADASREGRVVNVSAMLEAGGV
ncbi:MAG: Gfo/Idh/MocA family protein [Chloroflexia bacterium]